MKNILLQKIKIKNENTKKLLYCDDLPEEGCKSTTKPIGRFSVDSVD